MAHINGLILFMGVVVVSAVLCLIMWFVSRKSVRSDDRDERYNKIMLHNILPSNQGIPVDEVMVNLRDEDMSRFHLSSQGEQGAASADEI